MPGHHVEILIVTASREWTCRICEQPIQRGERLEFFEGPPRVRQHVACGLAARRRTHSEAAAQQPRDDAGRVQPKPVGEHITNGQTARGTSAEYAPEIGEVGR